MVFYNLQAQTDLKHIRRGMLKWKRIVLSFDFVMSYMNDILDSCDSIDKFPIHTKTSIPSHQHFGKYMFRYRRNKRTTWYIVYDIDSLNNIYINRILSNHISI